MYVDNQGYSNHFCVLGCSWKVCVDFTYSCTTNRQSAPYSEMRSKVGLELRVNSDLTFAQNVTPVQRMPTLDPTTNILGSHNKLDFCRSDLSRFCQLIITNLGRKQKPQCNTQVLRFDL